jgi:hypothetical protein
MDGRSGSIGSTVFRVIVSSFAAPVYGSLASAGATPQAIDGNKILGCEHRPGGLRAPAAAGPNEPHRGSHRTGGPGYAERSQPALGSAGRARSALEREIYQTNPMRRPCRRKIKDLALRTGACACGQTGDGSVGNWPNEANLPSNRPAQVRIGVNGRHAERSQRGVRPGGRMGRTNPTAPGMRPGGGPPRANLL